MSRSSCGPRRVSYGPFPGKMGLAHEAREWHRTADLMARPGIEQVFCFENRGEEIGVTLTHPHGQIYGYPYLTPRHFLAERDRFEGWDKYNRAYWLAEYPDFAQHFIRNICSEPHSTKQIEDAMQWAGETTGPLLVKTV